MVVIGVLCESLFGRWESGGQENEICSTGTELLDSIVEFYGTFLCVVPVIVRQLLTLTQVHIKRFAWCQHASCICISVTNSSYLCLRRCRRYTVASKTKNHSHSLTVHPTSMKFSAAAVTAFLAVGGVSSFSQRPATGMFLIFFFGYRFIPLPYHMFFEISVVR